MKHQFAIISSAAAAAAASVLYARWRKRRLTGITYDNGTYSDTSAMGDDSAAEGDLLTAAVTNITDTLRKTLGMKYFTIAELTRSATASRLGISNTPGAEARQNLETLITECLDPIRTIYGKPIVVSSGYRCQSLNAAVGGSSTSQHLTGQAADLVPASGGSIEGIFRACVAFGQFDQLIIEQSGKSRWVHVSYSPRNRRRILAYRNGTYTDITNSWESYLA